MARRMKLTPARTRLSRCPARRTRPNSEAHPNPHGDSDYVVRFTAPEFTSLCPVTGQPDFAHFVDRLLPGEGDR